MKDAKKELLKALKRATARANRMPKWKKIMFERTRQAEEYFRRLQAR